MQRRIQHLTHLKNSKALENDALYKLSIPTVNSKYSTDDKTNFEMNCIFLYHI